MIKLIYASQATAPVRERALIDLLAAARAHNERAGITGLLLYAHGSFMQVLEGEPDVVEPLYERISADERHTHVRRLTHTTVKERSFAQWSMGFEHPDDLDLAERLPGFRPSVSYPLVNAELVLNGAVAEALLRLYARNEVSE